MPKWARGAVCDDTGTHTTCCDQSHNSRTRMVQTECALQRQAVAEARALPMCRAPVESTTSRTRWALERERPYGPGAYGAVGRERTRRSMNSQRPQERGQKKRNHGHRRDRNGSRDPHGQTMDTGTHVHVRTIITHVSTHVSTHFGSHEESTVNWCSGSLTVSSVTVKFTVWAASAPLWWSATSTIWPCSIDGPASGLSG